MSPDELTATNQAMTVVESFLAAVGRGDTDAASRHLDPGVRMLFPGGKVFSSLGELADASSSRYRHVDKHEMEYEARLEGNGDVVVFVMGSLFGENSFGVPFDHVRFVDRFVVRDGLILDQRVWNDLAESGVLRVENAAGLDPAWRPGTTAAATPTAKVRRTGHLRWHGDLRRGNGVLDLAGGAARGLSVSLQTRRQADGSSATSPEELLAAAHAACFGMALRGALDTLLDQPATDHALEVDGTCILRIDSRGWRIEAVDLTVRAGDIDPDVLAEAVATAEKGCAISKALAGNVAVTVTVAGGTDER